MYGLPSMQLDNPQHVPLLWPEPTPGVIPPQSTRPRAAWLHLPPPRLPHLACPTPVWQRLDSARLTAKKKTRRSRLKMPTGWGTSSQLSQSRSERISKANWISSAGLWPHPHFPRKNAGLTPSSEDMVDLQDMPKQRGLLAGHELQKPNDGSGKRPRVGPRGAALADPALANKLAASVAYVRKHMKPSGGESAKRDGDGSLEKTQAASASKAAAPLASQQAQGLRKIPTTFRHTPSLGESQVADTQPSKDSGTLSSRRDGPQTRPRLRMDSMSH